MKIYDQHDGARHTRTERATCDCRDVTRWPLSVDSAANRLQGRLLKRGGQALSARLGGMVTEGQAHALAALIWGGC